MVGSDTVDAGENVDRIGTEDGEADHEEVVDRTQGDRCPQPRNKQLRQYLREGGRAVRCEV